MITRRFLCVVLLGFGLQADLGHAQAPKASESASVHCTAFRKWAESGNAMQERARGVELAHNRRNEVKKLIMRDPARALSQRLSKSERKKLPPEVDAELEIEVEGPAVVGPLRGPLAADPDAAPSISLTIKGHVYRAYLHGNQLKKRKWDGDVVRGIAVGGHMVMEDVAADGSQTAQVPERIKKVYIQQFKKDDFTFSKNGDFDVVEAEGWVSPAEQPGMPVLPAKMLEVAIPSGANVTGVSVTGAEMDFRSDFVPYPEQPDYPLSYEGEIKFIEPNPEAYASDQMTPATLGELTGDHSMRGFQFVTLRLNPLRYLPSEKQLKLVTDMEITVEYDLPLVKPTLRSRRMWEDTKKTVQARVINPEVLDTGGFHPLLDDSAGQGEN